MHEEALSLLETPRCYAHSLISPIPELGDPGGEMVRRGNGHRWERVPGRECTKHRPLASHTFRQGFRQAEARECSIPRGLHKSSNSCLLV